MAEKFLSVTAYLWLLRKERGVFLSIPTLPLAMYTNFFYLLSE